MKLAYILINCELGAEEDMIKGIKKVEGVKSVHGTYGAYDVLVMIESESMEKLRETITNDIRSIDKIRSTLTLMSID